MNEPTITITQKRLGELLKTENFFQALKAAGVNNWSGWGEQEDCEPFDNAVDAAVASGTLTADGPPDLEPT